MTTSFPESLDNLTNPLPGDDVSVVSHASQHSNANDAIEALEAKVGSNGSTVESSHDYKIGQLESNTHTHTNKAVLDATTSPFTTEQASKISSIEDNATADQTPTEIVAAITSEIGNEDWKTQLPKRTQEEIEDYVASLFQAGSHTNITVTYDDVAGSISLAGQMGGGATLTQEEVEDFVGGVLAGDNGITITYDDAGNQVLVSLSGLSFTSALNTKLAGIEENATADQTNAEIETAYNTQVAQVSDLEKTEGTATQVKRFAPADVKDMIDTHSGSGGGSVGDLDSVTDNGNITNNAVTVGGLTTSAVSPTIAVEATGHNANFVFGTLVGKRSLFSFRKGGKNRWLLENDGSAETGSNAGSDFRMNRYSDAGAYTGTPLVIKRSTGYFGISNNNPQSQLDVTGDAEISGTLDVGGYLDVGSGASINGTLDCGGANFGDDIDVTGNINAVGNLSVDNITGLNISAGGPIKMQAVSAPAAETNSGKIWISNGTGAGDAGDLMVTINSGGVTKTATLVDFSMIL